METALPGEPMKILISSNNATGLYKFRRELIEELVKTATIYVCVPNGSFVEMLERLGCNVILCEIERRGKNIFKDLNLIFFYRRLIKKISPSVVLTYTIKPNCYCGIACGLLKIPYIANVTGLGTVIENDGIYKNIALFLYKLGLRKAGCVYFQNSDNQKFFKQCRITKGKTRLICGSGVNIEQFDYKPYPKLDTPIVFTFVGRMMKDKGITELVDAARYITRKYEHVRFDLIGSFDENYYDLIQSAHKEHILNYLGFQMDVRPYYKDSWAILIPSYHEGMCNVCLEGAATGRPVLASKVPGCRETFEEGITGFGFEAKDTKSLIEAIEQFIVLPYEEKVEMGIKGREKMEREFNRNMVISSYINGIIEVTHQ